MSVSDYLETKILDLVFNATAYAGQSTVYIKLHLGDPGDTGTANPASETTRKAATFAAASGGSISNDATSSWTAYPATETITYVSLWDAVSGGNCLWAGSVGSNPVIAGDTVQFTAGTLTVTVA